MKPTLVLGASPNPYRYAHRAIKLLREYGHEVHALGRRAGEVAGVPIHTQKDQLDLPPLDTLTLYLNSLHQREHYDWILDLKPRRVIFNPGTENPALVKKLQAAEIEPIHACTLVMLQTAQY